MTSEACEVKAFIVSSLLQPLSVIGFDAQSVPDDFDLRAGGVIDSLGFIELICRLEERFGGSSGLADVPPELLTNLGALCTHIAAQRHAGDRDRRRAIRGRAGSATR